MFSFNLLNCDAPRPWGMYFQDTASPQMEALVELHDNIMFYLVIILFGVGWILVSLIRNYVRNKISNKYLNHGTLNPKAHQCYPSYQYPDLLSDDNEEFDLYEVSELSLYAETSQVGDRMSIGSLLNTTTNTDIRPTPVVNLAWIKISSKEIFIHDTCDTSGNMVIRLRMRDNIGIIETYNIYGVDYTGITFGSSHSVGGNNHIRKFSIKLGILGELRTSHRVTSNFSDLVVSQRSAHVHRR